MSRILTITLVKGNRTVRVNADDTLRFIQAGWERIKARKQTTDPDILTAEAIADKAIGTKDDTPDLSDLQA